MRINKRLFYGIIFAVIVIVVIIIVKFVFVSEKGKILSIIKEGKAAIEAEDAAKSMSYVSLQYSDDYGLKYLMVQRILIEVFKEFDGFNVILNNIEIEVNEDKAIATFDLRVNVTLHNQQGYLVGTNDGPARVKMDFIKERFKWQVVKVAGIKMPYK
ncbi:MAG: hypothetical protein HZA06_02600 [Nitrospirae bacterium]|nr:hypothetical protein [Nitrospirota bacterium]